MKDYLQEIVKHTQGLGLLELIKITGTDTSTIIEAIGDDRLVILHAKFKSPVPEFVGVFGMPNLGLLNTILNIPEYQDSAKLSLITKTLDDGTVVPSGVHFENKSGDFKNDYRFMDHNVVAEKLKSVTMKSVAWHVEFEPTANAIMRLKFQAQANPQEPSFVARTENGDLKVYFGDPASHAGNFVFQDSVTGKLTRPWHWPVNVVVAILGLSGDKKIRLSDEGVMQITVDSGLGVYDYKIPALSK